MPPLGGPSFAKDPLGKICTDYLKINNANYSCYIFKDRKDVSDDYSETTQQALWVLLMNFHELILRNGIHRMVLKEGDS
jgi:hypothetical protein